MPSRDTNASLDSPERFVDGYLPALLAQASHLISAEFHAVVRAQGLAIAEWRVLASLADGRAVTTGQLAQLVLGKQPTVTRQLDRMQANGYVERRDDDGDRRITLVRITPVGREVVNRLIPFAREHENRVLAPFGLKTAEELKDLLRSLIKIHLPPAAPTEEPGMPQPEASGTLKDGY